MSRSRLRYGRLAALTTAAAWTVHTALFGSDRLSERAFRLLRWIADQPEPSKHRPR
ncbi:hypothetical protein [Nonomuraea wenchangensis]|uniref:Uncharacterized protein n=1 Tax=Nonomuraea wenchangensis TaxID=568860 RepID=A0A1I0LUX5_9ACTN|nr:hypothetical protein [Nonomuraea wenchangensis]SEU47440.1 hypothetical protein SAMN05421811_12914 [Nonomuraea wenchangensis]